MSALVINLSDHLVIEYIQKPETVPRCDFGAGNIDLPFE